MTKEERKANRELDKLLNSSIRVVCKKYHFKSIMGIAYIVKNDFLYELMIVTNGKGNGVIAHLSAKPLIIDDIFWKAFRLWKEAEKKPFSFHVNAVFVPHTFLLTERKYEIEKTDNIEKTLNEVFDYFEKEITIYSNKLSIIKYMDMLTDNDQHTILNLVLCNIALGDLSKAIEISEREISLGHPGPFLSKNGDIFHLIVNYCKENQLKTEFEKNDNNFKEPPTRLFFHTKKREEQINEIICRRTGQGIL